MMGINNECEREIERVILSFFLTSHHVHNVDADFHNELLWHNQPESQLLAESVLA
jgi:hypothetical protein